MARKETNPYGYREFYRDLKAGRLFACYVLEGEEEFVRALADRFGEGNVRTVQKKLEELWRMR